MNDFTDFIVEKLIIPIGAIFILIVLIFLLIGLPYIIYVDSKSETFELKKSQWTCLKSHSYQTTTYVKIGNILSPITSMHSDCVNYQKIID